MAQIDYAHPPALSAPWCTMPTVTDDEHTALHIEAAYWKHLGAKEAHIRETLGWSAVRHAQVVNALIDRADVEAAEPMVVHRLRRLREKRRHAKAC